MLTSMSDLPPVPHTRHRPLGLKIGLVRERPDVADGQARASPGAAGSPGSPGSAGAQAPTTLADEFSEAARALGAEVTALEASRLFGEGRSAGDEAELRDLARVLGRLYDVVVCDGLPAAMTQRLADAATVPVHALSELLPRGDAADGQLASDADRRRWRAQAAVLAALR